MDLKGPEMKLSTLSLDHLGLVAAIFDALGISEVIDGVIPKTRDCKLSHSAIIGLTHLAEASYISCTLLRNTNKMNGAKFESF